MSNEIAKSPRFSVAVQNQMYQKTISDTLQDPKRVQRFTSSIISAVAATPALQDCEPASILSCALLGEALELSPSPQLGHFYLVPFEADKLDGNGNKIYKLNPDGTRKKKLDKQGKPTKWDETERIKNAQFIIGYKGYKNLAMRSGLYRSINVVAVKEGEFRAYNPFTSEFIGVPIEDPLQREVATTVGYYGFYELLNGYKEITYWTKQKMEQHALKYSAGYASDKKYNNSYTFWSKDFDGMAYKTILRQLLSKAPMSIEMRQAFENDIEIVDTDGSIFKELPSNSPEPMIEPATVSMADL